jgi:transposase
MLQPLMRRTWAKKGETPILKAWDRHDRLTVISAVVWEPHRSEGFQLYFQIKPRNANAEGLFWFLIDLHRELKNQMVVIWDRLSAHRKTDRVMQELELPWIRCEYLPAYCPELNPFEHVWSTIKYGRMSNWPAPDMDGLLSRVRRELVRHSKDRRGLKNHFRWAKLELA